MTVLYRFIWMPPLNSEDRVRELCARATAAKTDAELLPVLLQLQSAIAEQIRRIRLIAAKEIPRAFRSNSKAAD